MGSRHMNSRRRSYGRRVHELRERSHEGRLRRMNREELRLAATTQGGEEPRDDTGWDRDWHDTRDAD